MLPGMVCTPGMPGTAARMCHEPALSHCTRLAAAPTHLVPAVMGGSERAMCKDIGSRISTLALKRRGLRQPSHRLHGRPHETAEHRCPRWVANLRKFSAQDLLSWHLCNCLCRFGRRILSDIIFDLENTASACSLYQDCISASCPDFGFLLLGFTKSGNTGGATLITCCLNARVSWV